MNASQPAPFLASLRRLWGEPASRRQQRWTCAALVPLVLLLWLAYGLRDGAPVFPNDDAYILLHNARVLREGADPNYPGVSPLYGTTSAVHLGLVALLGAALPLAWALAAALWLAGTAYALGLARLAFVHGASLPQAVLLVAAGLFLARTPHQLLNGLETGLMLAALTWALALAADRGAERGRALPVLCGALPFIRPELAVVSALLLLLRALQHAERRVTREEALRAAGVDLGLALLGALPWAVWYWTGTGMPYPATVSAKRLFFAEGCYPAAVRTKMTAFALEAFSAELGFFALGAVLLLLTRVGWIGLAFALAVIAAYHTHFPGALAHYEHRYLYVLVPFLLYALAAALREERRLVRWTAAALLIAGTAGAVRRVPDRWREYVREREFTVSDLRGVAEWTNAHLPPGSRLLIHDAGYIAYATRFPLTDFVGLKTPSSVEHHRRWTWPSCGARRAVAVHEIAAASAPDYLVMLGIWDRIFKITPGLRALGWRLEELRPTGAYRVYRLTPPEAAGNRAAGREVQ